MDSKRIQNYLAMLGAGIIAKIEEKKLPNKWEIVTIIAEVCEDIGKVLVAEDSGLVNIEDYVNDMKNRHTQEEIDKIQEQVDKVKKEKSRS